MNHLSLICLGKPAQLCNCCRSLPAGHGGSSLRNFSSSGRCLTGSPRCPEPWWIPLHASELSPVLGYEARLWLKSLSTLVFLQFLGKSSPEDASSG